MMPGLLFSFSEMSQEIEAFKGLSKGHVDKASLRELDGVKQTLDAFRTSGHSNTRWQIPQESPLWSQWSDGAASPGKKNAYRMRAGLSFIWEIRVENATRSQFALDGLAAILVRVEGHKTGGETSELARWHVDVGTKGSPGPPFHIQVESPATSGVGFPKDLEIPRFSAAFMTPMLAFEAVLAELFQDSWKSHTLKEDRFTRAWYNIQRPRFERLFEWQRDRLMRGVGSPWTLLKVAHPEPNLFCK